MILLISLRQKMFLKNIQEVYRTRKIYILLCSKFFRLHALSELCMLCTYVGMCKMLILSKLQNFGIKKHIFWDVPETKKQTKTDARALRHFLPCICINCSHTQKGNHEGLRLSVPAVCNTRSSFWHVPTSTSTKKE